MGRPETKRVLTTSTTKPLDVNPRKFQIFLETTCAITRCGPFPKDALALAGPIVFEIKTPVGRLAPQQKLLDETEGAKGEEPRAGPHEGSGALVVEGARGDTTKTECMLVSQG